MLQRVLQNRQTSFHVNHYQTSVSLSKKKGLPIVEKNDLSPHSATKTKMNVLTTVLAAAIIPAPSPENSEIANSA